MYIHIHLNMYVLYTYINIFYLRSRLVFLLSFDFFFLLGQNRGGVVLAGLNTKHLETPGGDTDTVSIYSVRSCTSSNTTHTGVHVFFAPVLTLSIMRRASSSSGFLFSSSMV